MHPDQLVTSSPWSELARTREAPQIDVDRMHRYRTGRLRSELDRLELDMVLIHNPVSLRYAFDYRSYQLFQSRTPTTYAFFAADGPTTMHAEIGTVGEEFESRPGRALSYFDGGEDMHGASACLADDVVRYLESIGATRRRVGLEYVNPSVTRALLERGVDAVDGMPVTERARLIKSSDEIECIRWAIAVAEHGIAKLEEVLEPGVTELQLWALLNYANLANDGDWHDGRMLASGPRTNPWLQEASPRRIESGDLVAFDTDMVGPMGYFADISRTVFCAPGTPSMRQRELFAIAAAEVEHNIALVRPGITLHEFQQKAYVKPEEFHEQDYPCIVHAVGMCDEYPRIDPAHRGANRYDDTLEEGMVLCIESYVGAIGEPDGVKLEEQVVVTAKGCEQLTSYPYDERLRG
ncbi:MAG: M24 family metallopeptidase [Acidimicrobiales bacterium]